MHVGIKWHHLGPDLCLSLINTFLVFNSAYSVKLSSYKKHIRLFLVITNNVQYLKDDKLLSTGVQKPISTRSCLSNITSNNKQNLPTTRFLKSLKTLFYHKKNTLHQKLWFPHAGKPQGHQILLQLWKIELGIDSIKLHLISFFLFFLQEIVLP